VVERRCSFIGSTNVLYFLPPEETNRRWIVIEPKNIQVDHKLDIVQLFAEAIQMIREGKQRFVSPDDYKNLQEVNSRYTNISTTLAWVKDRKQYDKTVPERDITELYVEYAGWCEEKQLVKSGIDRFASCLNKRFADLKLRNKFKTANITQSEVDEALQ
jgi:predicted P-loop ATPase